MPFTKVFDKFLDEPVADIFEDLNLITDIDLWKAYEIQIFDFVHALEVVELIAVLVSVVVDNVDEVAEFDDSVVEVADIDAEKYFLADYWYYLFAVDEKGLESL